MKRSPMPRKRAGKPRRTTTPRCTVRSCKRAGQVAGMCKTHATRRADTLFSRFIRDRDGQCVACGKTEGLQCAHLVSRRYHAVRWDRRNAVALCAGCHVWYTHHPLEWDVWCTKWWGGSGWWEIRNTAMHGPTPDLADVIAELER